MCVAGVDLCRPCIAFRDARGSIAVAQRQSVYDRYRPDRTGGSDIEAKFKLDVVQGGPRLRCSSFDPRNKSHWANPKRALGGPRRMVTYNASTVRGCLQDEGVEVPLDNHVLYRLHCDFEKVCIRCVGVVNVDFLFGLSHQVSELVGEEVLPGLDIGRLAGVVWEYLIDWTHATRNLLTEQIDLVQE